MKIKKHFIAIAILGGFLFTGFAAITSSENGQESSKIEKKPMRIIAKDIEKKPMRIIAKNIEKKPMRIIASTRRIEKKPMRIIA